MGTRLEPWLEDWLEDFCLRRGDVGASEGLRRLVLERWAVETHPHLEWSEGPHGLGLAVRDGPEVREVLEVWMALGRNAAALFEHFAGLVAPEALEEALDVYGQAERLVEVDMARDRSAASVLRQLLE